MELGRRNQERTAVYQKTASGLDGLYFQTPNIYFKRIQCSPLSSVATFSSSVFGLDKLKLIGDDKGGLYLFDRDIVNMNPAKK